MSLEREIGAAFGGAFQTNSNEMIAKTTAVAAFAERTTQRITYCILQAAQHLNKTAEEINSLPQISYSNRTIDERNFNLEFYIAGQKE